MATSKEVMKESRQERLWRFARNFNALGAVALGGLAIMIPGPNVILGAAAAVNVAQAGGSEVLRKRAEKKHKKKNKPSY